MKQIYYFNLDEPMTSIAAITHMILFSDHMDNDHVLDKIIERISNFL